MPDIVRLRVNTKGSDYIIADLHGSNGSLTSVINKLNLGANDRLFIAGDLVDRGPDSLGVIKTIINSKANLQVIRGNHEEMTLTSILALETIVREIVKEDVDAVITKELIIDKMKHMLDNPVIASLKNNISQNNGGMWIVDLFAQELVDGKIDVNEKGEMVYAHNSDVDLVYNYMSDLPYIINVEGNEDVPPFNVVHADMPINDFELERRVSSDQMLGPDERIYAIWARKNDISIPYDPEIGRTVMSVLAYCGHRIIGFGDNECVRRDTSMADLDRATYYANIALVANHKAFMVNTISNTQVASDFDQMRGAKTIAKEILNFMAEKNQLFIVGKILKRAIDELNEVSAKDIDNHLALALKRVNYAIAAAPKNLGMKEWSLDDLLMIINYTPGINSEKLRNVNYKIMASYIESQQANTKTREDIQALRKYVDTMADNYNFYHQPEHPLQYDDLFEKLFPPQTHLVQQGLFAEKDKRGETMCRALIGLLAKNEDAFIDNKKAEYEEKFDENDVAALDKIVQDAADFISSQNFMISDHNKNFPDHKMDHETCEGFYEENKWDLYAEFEYNQRSYIKNSLAIEDIKQLLAAEVGKCASMTKVSEKISDSYLKIADIVNKHNAKHRPVIKLISQLELQSFADRVIEKAGLRAAKL